MQDFNQVTHSFISLQLMGTDVKIISEQTAYNSGAESNWTFSDRNHKHFLPVASS